MEISSTVHLDWVWTFAKHSLCSHAYRGCRLGKPICNRKEPNVHTCMCRENAVINKHMVVMTARFCLSRSTRSATWKTIIDLNIVLHSFFPGSQCCTHTLWCRIVSHGVQTFLYCLGDFFGRKVPCNKTGK